MYCAQIPVHKSHLTRTAVDSPSTRIRRATRLRELVIPGSAIQQECGDSHTPVDKAERLLEYDRLARHLLGTAHDILPLPPGVVPPQRAARCLDIRPLTGYSSTTWSLTVGRARR
jgi:hypothetical protein